MKELDSKIPSAIVVTMKLLILSDTHGNYPLALRALERAGQVDQIVHLGDELEDATVLETILDRSLIKVPGNCDASRKLERDLLIDLAGIRFFITHGDRYHVKSGLTELHKKALEQEAQAVLFGHTHEAAIVRIGGILLVNPGSLSYKSLHTTFAVLSIIDGAVSAELFPLELPVKASDQQPHPQL